MALWAVPFGLIGGRLYHVLTDWKTYFGPDGAGLAAALRIWEGGLGIWGAVALGGVGAWIGCRRKGIPLPAFGDAVAPGIVLAQAIGRLGNYFNQELYGRETTVPWGMEIFYRRDSSGVVDVHSLDGVSTGEVAAVVHPTFLYELLWNLLVFVLLIWADRRFRLGHGRLFALYVAAYCVGRFWIEWMRDDTATEIAGIRINVFTATFVFIGAVVYMLLAPKGRENPASLRGKQPAAIAEESRVEEWAEDLVAAATGSGIVAAATVAGEHDLEDAVAVGDVAETAAGDATELKADHTDEAEETEAADEIAVETDAEIDAEADEVEQVIHDLEVAASGLEAEAEAEAVAEAEDDAEAEAESTAIDDEAEAATAADDTVVVVYEESVDEPATVVVYESDQVSNEARPVAEAVVAAEAPEVETPEVEAPEVETPEVEAPEVETPEVEAPEEAVQAETQPETQADIEAIEAESAPAAGPEAVTEDLPADDEPIDGEPEKLKGSTLKRLLWGAPSSSE